MNTYLVFDSKAILLEKIHLLQKYLFAMFSSWKLKKIRVLKGCICTPVGSHRLSTDDQPKFSFSLVCDKINEYNRFEMQSDLLAQKKNWFRRRNQCYVFTTKQFRFDMRLCAFVCTHEPLEYSNVPFPWEHTLNYTINFFFLRLGCTKVCI